MPDQAGELVRAFHARTEIERRGIDDNTIWRVLEDPEQRETVRSGRMVFQSRFDIGGKEYLVRVFVDVDRMPAEVVTAYRTSTMGKYGRKDP